MQCNVMKGKTILNNSEETNESCGVTNLIGLCVEVDVLVVLLIVELLPPAVEAQIV